MLSPLDDLPLHQVAETLATVGTSDRNFYDRYYFNLHGCDDELFVVVGSGQYPNRGVTDAFVAVSRGEVQHVVRSSRELGRDRRDTRVGPIEIDVLEGLERLRVICDAPEAGIELDATWEGAVPAFQEPRQQLRAPHGRLILDTMRFLQTGSWSGRVAVDGDEIPVTPDRFWGSRDRSWGIRPVGEPESEGIGGGYQGFFWIYAVPRFPSTSIAVMMQEEPDATRTMEEAVRLHSDPERPPEPLGTPTHDLSFAPGTRDVTTATIEFAHGESLHVETLRPVRLGRGTGYGFDDDWRHGQYQGSDLVVQDVRVDLTADDVQPIPGAITDWVARFETGDGEVGYGLFEVMVLGPHADYFEGWE